MREREREKERGVSSLTLHQFEERTEETRTRKGKMVEKNWQQAQLIVSRVYVATGSFP